MKTHYTFTCLFFFLITLVSFKSYCQYTNLTFTPYINSGLISPVHINNCGDNRLFIVEQDGRIRIKHPGVNALDTFLDINARVGGGTGTEQGLLSVAFHPNYKTNGYFYVDYTNNNFDTRISRFSVNPTDSNKALPNSEVILLTIWQPYSNHNGGQLQFGPDGYLYVGMGDGGSGNDPENRAQNKDSLLGKILRLDVDNGTPYGIPPDNPFINDPDARPEIWTYGMRNPWRFSFDRLNGDLWIADVGQNQWEEVDYQPNGTGAGDNYGWRCWEATHATGLSLCTGVPNQHPPIYEYSHSVGYSITGGYVYRGAQYANMYGHYFFSDYGVSLIQSLHDSTNGFVHYNLANFLSGNGSPSTFGEDMLGELYIANINSGVIYRIGETTCKPVAFISAKDTMNVCDSVVTLSTPPGDSLLYNWTDGNGGGISVAHSVTVNQNGWYHLTVYNTQFCSNSDSVYVNLLGPPPVASFTGLDTFYCVYNGADTLYGTPAGGVFTGSGITDSIFNPDSAGIGIHIISYNYTDGNGCVSSAKLIIRIDACVGMSEISGIKVENLYPNPVADHLNLQLSSIQSSDALIELNDITGRKVNDQPVVLQAGNNLFSMDISKLENGIYVLHLITKEGSLTRRFIIEK